MAYTASAVTFMLPNIDVPVVFTGSQLPLTDMLSDGPDNLRTPLPWQPPAHPACFWPLTGSHAGMPGGEGSGFRVFRL